MQTISDGVQPTSILADVLHALHMQGYVTAGEQEWDGCSSGGETPAGSPAAPRRAPSAKLDPANPAAQTAEPAAEAPGAMPDPESESEFEQEAAASWPETCGAAAADSLKAAAAAAPEGAAAEAQAGACPSTDLDSAMPACPASVVSAEELQASECSVSGSLSSPSRSWALTMVAPPAKLENTSAADAPLPSPPAPAAGNAPGSSAQQAAADSQSIQPPSPGQQSSCGATVLGSPHADDDDDDDVVSWPTSPPPIASPLATDSPIAEDFGVASPGTSGADSATPVSQHPGSTEGASGLTSLIKAVLALENRTIPPNIKFSSPNPSIPWEAARFAVPLEPTPWPAGKKDRVSINNFGLGGSNGKRRIRSVYYYSDH